MRVIPGANVNTHVVPASGLRVKQYCGYDAHTIPELEKMIGELESELAFLEGREWRQRGEDTQLKKDCLPGRSNMSNRPSYDPGTRIKDGLKSGEYTNCAVRAIQDMGREERHAKTVAQIRTLKPSMETLQAALECHKERGPSDLLLPDPILAEIHDPTMSTPSGKRY